MAKAKQKILWALDPFEQSDTRSHIIETLRELSSQGATIDPVYVLSPDEYDIDVQFNSPWLKQIRPTAEKVLIDYLKDVKINGLSQPHVIIEKRPSLSRAVTALVAYAKRTKADTIVVGTHGKKGITRFFVGSFTETLLLKSQTPVLVIGPHSETPNPDKKTSHILFSTDFGPASYPTFKKVLALAKTRQSKITIFHCLPHPVEPFFQSGVYLLGGGYVSFPDYITRDEKRKKVQAEKYVNLAQKDGILVEINFNAGHGSTADAIVQQAQSEKTDFIAMAAESGALSAALIGSVTRQVVRSAPCPVWVLRNN